MEDGVPIKDVFAPTPALLDDEWARVTALVTLAEAARTGAALADDFEDGFAALQDRVTALREAGSWAALRGLMTDALLGALMPFDLDLLALVLVVEASPMTGPRLQALQPFLNTPQPALPLVQELLMLDSGDDVSLLMARLAPTAPLIAGQLVRLDRQGDYLVLRPTSRLVRALLARPADPGPPPGADLVVCDHGWDALVAPQKVLARLREFTGWISARDAVFGTWGGRRIGGPMALFSGGSGVGKSFSVAVLTHELGVITGAPWALYRLDLGRIVSKYVGETEKNLNALLDALHGTRAVLQIDEADGLLGKRGEVSDARDRYANLEVSHMLSRFEAHDGPVVLTTNLRANIDSAFLRRFQVIVDFPSPDAAMRSDLWARLLPPGAPLDPAVNVADLGDAAPLPGGGIHNAAIYAAVLAAQAGSPITRTHLAQACWRELTKEPRAVRRSELGCLADHLPEEEALT